MTLDFSSLSTEEKIKRAKIHLYKRSPFFAYILLHMNPKECDDELAKKVFGGKMPTMGVDKFGNLYWSKEFVDKLDNEELQAVLSHEVLHLALMHLERGAGKEPEVFNIANDLVVNSVLKQESFKLPECGMIPEQDHTFTLWGKKIEKINERSSEDIYAELYPLLEKIRTWIKRKQQQGNGGFPIPGNSGGGGNSGSSSGNGPMTKDEEKEGDRKLRGLDGHSYGNGGKEGKGKDKEGQGEGGTGLPEDQKRRLDELKKIISEGACLAKSQGLLPAGLERMVEDLLDSKVGWRHKLYKYIIDQLPFDYNWNMPSKRTLHLGIYTPRTLKESVKIVFHVDTSGSMAEADLQEALSELSAIISSFQNIHVDVLIGDAEMQNVFELTSQNADEIMDIAKKMKGGGGTDHVYVFDYVSEKITDAKVLLCFTDGYTTFPKKPEKYSFDTLWILSKGAVEDGAIPFGDIVRLGQGDW